MNLHCQVFRCKENYVLPSSLQLTPSLRSDKGYKLMVYTGFSFQKLRIHECHSSTLWLCMLFLCSLRELSALINNSETSRVKEFCHSKEQQTFTKQREKHDRKLRHLLIKRSPANSGSSLKDKWVMNLFFEELSLLERSGLEKGSLLLLAKYCQLKLSLLLRRAFLNSMMTKGTW